MRRFLSNYFDLLFSLCAGRVRTTNSWRHRSCFREQLCVVLFCVVYVNFLGYYYCAYVERCVRYLTGFFVVPVKRDPMTGRVVVEFVSLSALTVSDVIKPKILTLLNRQCQGQGLDLRGQCHRF